MQLLHAFEREFVARMRLQCCTATLDKYRIELRHFAKFLGRPSALSDLDDDTIAALLAWRLENVSAASANKTRSTLLSLWRFLHRRGIVTTAPTVPKLTEPERIPEAWTLGQMARLLKSAQEQPGTYDGVPAGAWWFALLLVAWDTAERRGALLGLTWQHVDLAGRWVCFVAETRKGRKRDRLLRIHADTAAALDVLSEPRRGAVFPFPYHHTRYYQLYDEILSRAELPTGRRHKTHRVRRSTASHYEAQGGNATELLDHSSRALTKRSYIDPRIANEADAVDVLPRP